MLKPKDFCLVVRIVSHLGYIIANEKNRQDMIDATLRGEIKGLDELLDIVHEDYTFHDAVLEHVEWDCAKQELSVEYSFWYGLMDAYLGVLTVGILLKRK